MAPVARMRWTVKQCRLPRLQSDAVLQPYPGMPVLLNSAASRQQAVACSVAGLHSHWLEDALRA